MKAWLSAFAKFLGEFLVLLGLMALAAGMADSLAAPGLAALWSASAKEALRVFPLALALTVATGTISFSGSRKPPAILASVFLAGLLLGIGGFEARQAFRPEPGPVRPGALAGAVVEAGDRLVSATSIEGKTARRVVAVDFSTPTPLLAWAASTPLDARGALKLAGQSYSLVPSRADDKPFKLTEIPLLGEIPVPLRDLSPKDEVYSLARILAFLLFAIGLAAPALGLRWPLAAFTLALVAAGLAIAGDGLASGGEFEGLVASLFGAVGLRLGASWPLVAFEAVTGLLFAGLGLVLAARRGK